MSDETRAIYARQVRGWRAEMDRLGYEVVLRRHTQRQPVIDQAPYPDTQTVETWLVEQEVETKHLESDRFKTILRWTIAAAIAGTIAAVTGMIATWQALFR